MFTKQQSTKSLVIFKSFIFWFEWILDKPVDTHRRPDRRDDDDVTLLTLELFNATDLWLRQVQARQQLAKLRSLEKN